MPTLSTHEITQLLHDWHDGDQAALDRLVPLVYDELRRISKAYLRRQAPGQTLQTAALINEAYLQMVNLPEIDWQNRVHFFGVAARVMRHILIDRARAKRFAKRGGGAQQVSLDEAAAVSVERSEELLALDDALNRLAALDARQSRIVELRYFGGLTAEEVAEVLGIAAITVHREWAKAKGWLYRELSKTGGNNDI